MEHQIFRFAKMILRDKRSTSHDMVSLFVTGQNCREKGWKNHKEFLRLGAWNFYSYKVLQNCFVSDMSTSTFAKGLGFSHNCFFRTDRYRLKKYVDVNIQMHMQMQM